MLKITIKTLYDISRTNVVRNFTESMLPLATPQKLIENENDWYFAHRQQSNWETVLQLISLRVQPSSVKDPVVAVEPLKNFGYAKTKKGKVWTLEFIVDRPGVLTKEKDPIGLLKDDCTNVPLLTSLTEDTSDLENQKDNQFNIIFDYEEVSD